MTDEQLAILKNELLTDPKLLGYSQPPTVNDPADADLLNTIGLSAETIGNTQCRTGDVSNAVNVAEFNTLYVESPGKAELFMMLMGRSNGYFDITNDLFVSQILNIFTQAKCPLTRAALIALGTRPCSRAEALFGANVGVTYLDVGTARQS